jgi:hypothetical protein
MDGTKNRDSEEPIYNSHEKGKTFFGFAFVIVYENPQFDWGFRKA